MPTPTTRICARRTRRRLATFGRRLETGGQLLRRRRRRQRRRPLGVLFKKHHVASSFVGAVAQFRRRRREIFAPPPLPLFAHANRVSAARRSKPTSKMELLSRQTSRAFILFASSRRASAFGGGGGASKLIIWRRARDLVAKIRPLVWRRLFLEQLEFNSPRAFSLPAAPLARLSRSGRVASIRLPPNRLKFFHFFPKVWRSSSRGDPLAGAESVMTVGATLIIIPAAPVLMRRPPLNLGAA